MRQNASAVDSFSWDPSLPKRSLRLELGTVVCTDAGAGPPLLFLHGYGDELFTWRHQLRELRKHAHVFAFDLIGHGFSEKPPLAYTAQTYVDCVHQYMRAVGLERATLVGNSLGAAIALCVAKQHPHSVERLVLLGPTVPGAQPAGRFSQWVFWLAYHGRLGQWLLPTHWNTPIRLGLRYAVADPRLITAEVVRYYGQFPRTAGFKQAYLSTARHWHEWTWERPRVGELTMPVTLIWGERDAVNPIRQARLLQTIIPQAQLVRLPDCGHLPQSEDPERVNEVLRSCVHGSSSAPPSRTAL